MADWFEYIPLALQTLNAIGAGQRASTAESRAGRMSEIFDKAWNQYYNQLKLFEEPRKRLLNTLERRAGQRPFYSQTWGRYGG